MFASRHAEFLEALPPDWQIAPLSRLGRLVGGGTPSRNEPRFWEGDVRWATPSDITAHRGRVLQATAESLTVSGLRASGAVELPPGSVLLTTRATIGAVAIAGTSLTTNQGFRTLVPGPDVTSSYAYHLLQYIGPEIRRLAAGSTFDEIGGSELGQIRVPRPSPDEQRRIGALLDDAEDAIYAAEVEIDKLAKTRLAIEVAAVVEAEQTGRRARAARLFDIALGKKLYESAKSGRYARPYLANRNVQWDRVDLSDLPWMDFTPSEQREFCLEPGDLIVCEGGEAGRTAMWRGELDECYFQMAAHRLRRTTDEIEPRYMLAFMRVALRQGQLAHLVSQTSIAHLTKEKLATVDVPMLAADRQAGICQTLTAIDDLLISCRTRAEKRRQLYSGLVNDLLTGRTRTVAAPGSVS